MEISCFQENLAKGLGIVAGSVSKRSTLPVLGNVLLAGEDGRLKLAATNLETAVVCWVGGKVAETGAITVPAKTVADLVRMMPVGKIVEMSLDDRTQTLSLACEGSKARIKGITAQEFPLLPKVGDEERVEVDAVVLKRAISQVAFSAARDNSRPVLNGVMIRVASNEMVMAATDGFRLSERRVAVSAVGVSLTAVVPAAALTQLAGVLAEAETVHMSLLANRNQIVFDLGHIVFTSQIVAGKFPDYSAIIPTQHTTKAVFDAGDLRRAFQMVNVFAREENDTSMLRIGSDMASIEAQSSETGDNTVQVDGDISGGSVSIGIDSRYMLTALAVVDGAVAIECNGPTDPVLLRAVGEDAFLHIIMPKHFGS